MNGMNVDLNKILSESESCAINGFGCYCVTRRYEIFVGTEF